MTKTKPNPITIPDWNYSCTGCGECCRRWYVAISSEIEKKRLESLRWRENDNIPSTLFTTIKGHEYLAHSDGHCIFLEPEKNLCKIHGRFGIDAKPLGCRVYPYNITSTFPGKLSVIGRFDCPAVRENQGPKISSSRKSIESYANEMGIKGGMGRHQLDDLTESSIHKIVNGFFKHLFNKKDFDFLTMMKGAMKSVERLECLGSEFLTQMEMDEILPSFFSRVIDDLSRTKVRKSNAFERMMFLNIFAAYFRRDEELIGAGMKPRLLRTLAIGQIILGKGNLRTLGKDHPDFLMPKSGLFDTPPLNFSKIDWSMAIDLIKLRLQSYQFFGASNYNLSFFIGLKSLFLSAPLVLAAAKWSALTQNQQSCQISHEDIDYAISIIDHSLGRSALLSTGLFTTLVRQLTDFDRYSALLYSLSE